MVALAHNRFRALRSGGIRNTKVELQMKLNRNTEVESLHVSPPDAKPVLGEGAVKLVET